MDFSPGAANHIVNLCYDHESLPNFSGYECLIPQFVIYDSLLCQIELGKRFDDTFMLSLSEHYSPRWACRFYKAGLR